MTELLDYYIVKTARLWLILWNYPIDESSVVKNIHDMRRKPPKKSQLPKPEPIIIKINPLSKKQEILMPKIRYETIATIDMETKFTGEITPVPTVLIYIMTPLELKVITTIMQETYLNGRCLMTMKEMSIRFNCTYAAVQTVLSNLRRRSILLEEPSGNGGSGKNRMLNFKAIQHINDLVQGEDPGVYARIKSIIIRRDILTLTKEDIRKGYDNKVLPPGHDPVEEEEYD